MDTKKNTDEVALWRADSRETEKHPHLTGNAVVNGIHYKAAAWRASPEDLEKNRPFLKIQLTPKGKIDAKPYGSVDKTPPKPAEKAPSIINFEDDIPF